MKRLKSALLIGLVAVALVLLAAAFLSGLWLGNSEASEMALKWVRDSEQVKAYVGSPVEVDPVLFSGRSKTYQRGVETVALSIAAKGSARAAEVDLVLAKSDETWRVVVAVLVSPNHQLLLVREPGF